MARLMGKRSSRKTASAAPQPPPGEPNTWLIHGALLLLNLVVFAQTLGFPFISYDDAQFVFQNRHVQSGDVAWAWKSAELGYYPLTWLSHMLDVALFGLDAGGHHATSLLLHIASTSLLFVALRRLTGSVIRSAVVAALFAIHPMHVESVAWVAERRDTLSTLFAILALFFYASRRMIAVALALLASLLAKQMYVTLPFVLLLLDWWPLERRDWKRAVLEKWPLYLLALGGAAVAYFGQASLGAVASTETIPFTTRVGNAIVSYVDYLFKLFWPVNLAVLYPFAPRPLAQVLGALLLLIAITGFAIALRRKAPQFLFGWLWFLGTLVPVIGFITIGIQSIADRYTYFSYLGLFIAIIWSVPQNALKPAAAAAVLVLAVLAWNQTRYWRSSETLFAHAIEVTGSNPMMEYCLAQTINLTDPDQSLAHVRRALELGSERIVGRALYAQFHVAAGNALMLIAHRDKKSELLAEAETEFHRALALDHGTATANARKNLEEIQKMRAAMPSASPLNALFNRAMLDLKTGNTADALAALQQAVATDPNAIDARIYLALAFVQAQRKNDAIAQLEAAKRIDPARANEYLTNGLRLPPGPQNLDMLIARLKMP